MSKPLFGAIEAGGTKFNCAVGTSPTDLVATIRIPTTSPEATLKACIDFFKDAAGKFEKVSSIGISSFGPLDLHPNSPTYGSITKTPKAGWSNTSLVGPVSKALDCEVYIDTDVNGAALAEHQWGAAQDVKNLVYLTVGTGIGGGGMVNGDLIHGLVHTEMGHIRVVRCAEDKYPGGCPFHGDCFEGMASGPAFKARWGEAGTKLPMDHVAWKIEADYIAQAISNYIYVLSPERFVIGGGVMHHEGLFPLIRKRVVEILNGYVDSPSILKNIDKYIVPPGLGDNAGVAGGIALAARRKR